MGLKKAARKIAIEVVKTLVVDFTAQMAKEAGESLGRRIGAWIHPEGVDKDDDEDEETTEESDGKSGDQ